MADAGPAMRTGASPSKPQPFLAFNRPFLTGREFEYMQDAVSRLRLSGDGIYTRRSSALLEQLIGVKKALLTTSCTHALEMSALLLDLQPGDEVIVPSFTFASTINAFVLRGARPVFADIREDTLNLDERQVERLIGARTRAIVPVHYAGVGCEMDTIAALASPRDIAIVEDNAHGLFGTYRGKPLGTFGALATLSFHETKNITCGEGGALLINDERYIDRAEIIREKGTDRSRFFRGQVDKYTWVDLGSSYLPSDLLAAFLCAQLEAHQAIQLRRQRIWTTYYAELGAWALQQGVRLPVVPAHCVQPYHLFHLLMPTSATRTAFIEYLGARGIMSLFHYLPLHLSTMGQLFGGRPGDCPVTESVSDRLVRLPLHAALTESETLYIIETVRAFAGG